MAKKPTKIKPSESPRAPIITVMGHIDHGKTSLLDAIKKSHIAAKESGGITQHIGAYQISHKGRPLTFIDTPGHAAFAAMRSRGVKVTDIVILVIDAVEGIKPQTKECLDHIKTSKVPFLIALNKIDLPNAYPDVVKKQLSENNIAVEGFGGDIVCVPVSAKTKKGIDDLLEMILLSADMLELENKPDSDLKAVVIESSLDKNRGPLATVIVKSGQIKIGTDLFTDQTTAKIKAIFDADGKTLSCVNPGQPAQILGFKSIPSVGALVTSSARSNLAENKPKPIKPIKEEKDQTSLKIILKSDAAGTLEAITQNLGDEVTLISKGVGDINESDVALAQSTGAKVIGFRVKTTSSASRLAEIEKIFIMSYPLIHELLDDLQAQILKLLEPTIDEALLGEAKILAEFTVKSNQIAGCEVISGKFSVGDLIHLKRAKDQIASSKIKSIHSGKDSIDKAKKGDQCGFSFTTPLAFKIKDILIAYKKL